MPQCVWLHTLAPTKTGRPVEPEHRLPFAGFMDGIDIVSFASANDIQLSLGSSVAIVESKALAVSDMLQEKSALDAKKARYFLSRLMRECWEQWIGATSLGIYALSNKANCYFFKKGNQSNLDIHFTGINGKPTYRSVVGYATQADGSRRYWHYGVQARPVFAPSLAYLISAHVIFTSDGATPWPSHTRMHSARRRQCKNWFNPQWRDRLLATLHWLSQGNPSLCIPGGKDIAIEASLGPQRFEAGISYVDPLTRKERLLLSEVEQEAKETQDDEDEEIESEEEEDFEDDSEEEQT